MVMGILNVTPDSFSDGGQHLERTSAVAWGIKMLEDGADIIDVGGESTRPGSRRVDVDEELRRVVPVIDGLARRTKAVISVDTMKAEVAQAAIEAGAHIVNDVSALTHDPRMAEVAVKSGAGVVLMHMQGTPQTMQTSPHYEDVVGEVFGYLMGRIEQLTAVGMDFRAMAVDPGIGFGKTLEHSLELVVNSRRFRETGRPVLVGLSRKSFLGKLTGRDVEERLAGSLGALAFCMDRGVDIIRVHDVAESADLSAVIHELRNRAQRSTVSVTSKA